MLLLIDNVTVNSSPVCGDTLGVYDGCDLVIPATSREVLGPRVGFLPTGLSCKPDERELIEGMFWLVQ